MGTHSDQQFMKTNVEGQLVRESAGPVRTSQHRRRGEELPRGGGLLICNTVLPSRGTARALVQLRTMKRTNDRATALIIRSPSALLRTSTLSKPSALAQASEA